MGSELGNRIDALRKWRSLPKYRFEERFDIFLELYLDKILQEKYSDKYRYKYIVPQFPLKKEKNDSRNIDFAVLAENKDERKILLIELKTDMNSLCNDKGIEQIKFYKDVYKVLDKIFKRIIENIIKIYESPKCQVEKYEKLLEILEEQHFVISKEVKKRQRKGKWVFNNEYKNTQFEIIYIMPREILVEKDKNGALAKMLLAEFKKIYFSEIIYLFEEQAMQELVKEIVKG